MNAQNTVASHYNTVHRFARHHNSITSFLDTARVNDFDFASFGSIDPGGSNHTSATRPGHLTRPMAAMQSDEDMAHLQKLSNEYQPDVGVIHRGHLLLAEQALTSAVG